MEELAEFVGHKEFGKRSIVLQKVVSFLINNFPQVERYMNQAISSKVGNYELDKTDKGLIFFSRRYTHSSSDSWCW